MIIATLDDVLGNTRKIETRLSYRALLPCGKACHADAAAAKKRYEQKLWSEISLVLRTGNVIASSVYHPACPSRSA